MFNNQDLEADAKETRPAEPNCQYSGFSNSGSVNLPVMMGPPPEGPCDISESPQVLKTTPTVERRAQSQSVGRRATGRGMPQTSQKEAKGTTVSRLILAGLTRERRRGLKGPRGSLEKPWLTLTVGVKHTF